MTNDTIESRDDVWALMQTDAELLADLAVAVAEDALAGRFAWVEPFGWMRRESQEDGAVWVPCDEDEVRREARRRLTNRMRVTRDCADTCSAAGYEDRAFVKSMVFEVWRLAHCRSYLTNLLAVARHIPPVRRELYVFEPVPGLSGAEMPALVRAA